MPVVKEVNFKGEVIGEVTLSDAVFGAPIHVPAMHQVVVAHLANCRLGTHNTAATSAAAARSRGARSTLDAPAPEALAPRCGSAAASRMVRIRAIITRRSTRRSAVLRYAAR